MVNSHLLTLLEKQQWKAKDDPNATHDLSDLANELENMDEDKLDDIAEEGDEGPKDTRKNSKKKKSKGKYDSSDSDDESDDDDFKGEGGKINHDHLFAQSKGGAQVAQGDDDFDEEMGGESQIIEVCRDFCAKCCVFNHVYLHYTNLTPFRTNALSHL